ncbi:MAG: hypothetical protein KME30_00145 [Iphinoe sp. HA4291-MV1]|nr:hypothetical protein [Iphinoe sp. HA4291-MV1]
MLSLGKRKCKLALVNRKECDRVRVASPSGEAAPPEHRPWRALRAIALAQPVSSGLTRVRVRRTQQVLCMIAAFPDQN